MQPSPALQLTFLADELPARISRPAPLSNEALYALCRRNPELRIERTADGALIVMPPIGGNTGRRNASLVVDLGIWARAYGTGLVFDSSTGFLLGNGAERSADAAWVLRDRWEALTELDQERFPPLCPDFVAEIRSPSDRLPPLHAKLREYVENGARLGWLIDPVGRVVWVYRAGGAVERHDAPATLSGDPVLPGFTLATAELWYAREDA